MGKAIVSVPKPNMPKQQVQRPGRRLQIHSVWQRRLAHQRHRLTLRGLNHKVRNHPLGEVDRSGGCCRLYRGLRGQACIICQVWQLTRVGALRGLSCKTYADVLGLVGSTGYGCELA